MLRVRQWLGILGLLAYTASGCNTSANAPAVARPRPRVSTSPTRPYTGPLVNSSATARSKRASLPTPIALYSQEHVAKESTNGRAAILPFFGGRGGVAFWPVEYLHSSRAASRS